MIKIVLPNGRFIGVEKSAINIPVVSGLIQRYKARRFMKDFSKVLGGHLSEKVWDPYNFKYTTRLKYLQDQHMGDLMDKAKKQLAEGKLI